MIEHNSEVYNHPYISFFIVHVYVEEDLCWGLCSIIPLVSLLFAVLVSLHPATFLMFFIACNSSFQVPRKNLGSRACVNSGYQALFSPITECLGTRLGCIYEICTLRAISSGFALGNTFFTQGTNPIHPS